MRGILLTGAALAIATPADAELLPLMEVEELRSACTDPDEGWRAVCMAHLTGFYTGHLAARVRAKANPEYCINEAFSSADLRDAVVSYFGAIKIEELPKSSPLVIISAWAWRWPCT